jgi:Aspartate decarboxylase
VDVSNVNSGARWTTYVNEAPRVSRAIAVNGPGARLVQKGDKVIIIACCQVPAEEARNYRPIDRRAWRGERHREGALSAIARSTEYVEHHAGDGS